MFPPKVIGFIGSESKMARNIYLPFFTEAGYEVIGSDIADPHGLTSQQVIERADVVIFSILPLDSVALEIVKLTPLARPATLWLHGSSVQEVRDFSIPEALSNPVLREKGVDIGYFHFMVAPSVRSLKGQVVVKNFPRELFIGLWDSWLTSLLENKRARIFDKGFREHDVLTKSTQLVPMIFAVLEGMLWIRENIDVSEAMAASGAPARLQKMAAVRNIVNALVVSEIVTRHSDGPVVMESLKAAVEELERLILAKDDSSIRIILDTAKAHIAPEDFRKISAISDWVITVLGDLSSNTLTFQASNDTNKLGLLAQLASCLDSEGIDKNSTIAQTLGDHSARFNIGVEAESDDPGLLRAVEKARELGLELVPSEFTF